jgi:hypothetical protein
MRRWCGALWVLMAWVAVPAIGSGQAATVAIDDETYQAVIDKALLAYNQGHWTEAKVFFAQAHAIQPSARTLRGLGLASYESRSYVDAIDYLDQALVSHVHPLTPEMRMLAAELISEARQFVTRLRVELSPARATLRVDGKTVRRARGGVILLDPGEHELLAVADDFRPMRRRIESEGGRELRLRMVLARRFAGGSSSSETALASAAEPQAEARSLAPWILVGGSAALAAGGGIVLGLGLAAKAEVERAELNSNYARVRSAHERSVPLQAAGGVMLGLGVAGVVAGLAWEYWPAVGQEREGSHVRLRPDGLSWWGTFEVL